MLYYRVIPERKQLPFTRLSVSSVAQSCPTRRDPMDSKITVSIVSPFMCHEVMGLDAMILVF